MAYFPLHENANDESGHHHDGTTHGALTFVRGVIGQAAHFDGATTYIEVPDQSELRLKPPFSLSAWFKPEAPGRIIHKQGYELSVDPSGAEQTLSCVIGFGIWVRPLVMDAVTSPPLAKGEWHHVVATHDGSRLSIYINGRLRAQAAAEQTVPQTTADLNIGRNGYTGRDAFTGCIEEVRIYNRVLSKGEIEQLAQTNLSTSPGPAPVASISPDAPLGQLRILSGTGSFSPVSEANKILKVSAGANLNGTVALRAMNLGHGDAIAPLIYTPSWGEHIASWKLISASIPVGQSTQTAQVLLTVPSEPGTYHIIFAFAWELRGDQVASASNWSAGRDVWNDGNDIAEFNAEQLALAQKNGWTTNNLMYGPNPTHPTQFYQPQYYPADALTVFVTTP